MRDFHHIRLTTPRAPDPAAVLIVLHDVDNVTLLLPE
jgi:hypothetical protein